MAITYESRTYGPRPWQRMLYGDDGTTTTKPAYIYVPGGGWGLRNPAPVVDPSSAFVDPVVRGAIDNTNSADNETYRVFVLQVASDSQNDFNTLGVSAWADATVYLRGDFVTDSGTWRCTSAHTSSSGVNGPNDGGGATYWEAVDTTDCSNPIIPKRGDGTSAYAFQAAIDVKQAIAHIRQNAHIFNVNPDQICVSGSSAGGHAVGIAAFGDPLAFAAETHPTASHPLKTASLSTPNAVYLQITPTRLESYVTSSIPAVQGIFLSFMADAFGRPELTNFAGWDALPDIKKKSLDVLNTLERARRDVPTWLDYAGSKFDDRSTVQVYNGDQSAAWADTTSYAVHDLVHYPTAADEYICIQAHTSAQANDRPSDGTNWHQYWVSSSDFAPEVHHAYNGWLILNQLTKPESAGGFASTDTRMFQSDDTVEIVYTGLAGGSFAPGDVVQVDDSGTTLIAECTVISDDGSSMVVRVNTGNFTDATTLDNGSGVTASGITSVTNRYRTYTQIPDHLDLTDEGVINTDYTVQVYDLTDQSNGGGLQTYAESVVAWMDSVMGVV